MSDDPVFWRIYQHKRPGESDADFARRIGVKPATYSEWKRDKSKPSKRETLVQVAENLDVSLDWLVFGEEHEDPGPGRPSIVRQLNKMIGWIQGEAVDWNPDSGLPEVDYTPATGNGDSASDRPDGESATSD